MRKILSKHIPFITALCMSFSALATTTFNPANNELSIDTILLVGTIYKNVTVTLTGYTLNSVGSGAPANNSFDPQGNVLTLGVVTYQGTTYNNVKVGVKAYALKGATLAGNAVTCTAPQTLVAGVNGCVTPMGIKVYGANTINQPRVPPVQSVECYTTLAPCWTDNVKSGAIKLIATSALSTGALPAANSTRPIVFGYYSSYVNTQPGSPTPLFWKIIPVYADNAEMTKSATFSSSGFDINPTGGSVKEIDWVMGTEQGLINHEKESNQCYLMDWVPAKNGWNDAYPKTPVACP